MNQKERVKKVILIGICVVIIAIIFIRNIIGGVGTKRSDSSVARVEGMEVITKQEAYRLFSYVLYEKAQRESLNKVITNESHSQDPYVSYLNALVVAGVLDNEKNDNLFAEMSEPLSCGEFRDLLLNIVEAQKVDYKEVTSTLPERLKTVKRGDYIQLSEFLTVYEKLVETVSNEVGTDVKKTKISKQELFFVGVSLINENSASNQAIDKSGNLYYYSNFSDYSIFLDNNDMSAELASIEETKAEVDNYIDTPIEAVVCGSEIVYIRKVLENEVTLSNVWMLDGESTTIKVYVAGIEKEYKTVLPLSTSIHQKVGDITLEDGTITAVTVKPDTINGKVLLTTKKEIEIEGYGKLPFDENFKIYKIYGNLSMEKTNSILVGYTITDFVVSDGVICAALIKESIKAKNIRVLINTSNYESLYHKSVTLSADTAFTITYGEHQKLYDAGKEVTIDSENEMLKDGRMKISTITEGGKIKLISVNRAYGKPEYRGSMEIAKTESGLTLVNELSLEEYLYSVVPSEMPTSYGTEALKVQAVCARSFAYNQLIENKYSAYGAHVDDSVNSQVYNNILESEATILAVKDTYGQVLNYNDKVLTAYYFATSSGYTASVEDVWEGSMPTAYLQGYLQTEEKYQVDLSKDDDFRNFIDNDSVEVFQQNGERTKSEGTYDSGFLMYRWNVTISVDDLSKQINDNLSSIYNTNKNSILMLVSKKNTENLVDSVGIRIIDGAVYKSTGVSNIGNVTKLKVIKRGNSGIIKELLVTGSKGSVLICYQNNIRKLLAPVKDDLYRLDNSTVSSMAMLPSAFFYIDTKGEGKNPSAFTLTGGGYGHGVGMSQNGVKKMIDQGKTYDDVLKHYYSGIELGFVYE